MFTGIIETLGEVVELRQDRDNTIFDIRSAISDELKVDQSVSHNGVCLTVTEIKNGIHSVTAIAETLERSNLGNLQTGGLVNLERCMTAGGRYDGHIVQGHVDQTAHCTEVLDLNGSWKYFFEYDPDKGNFTVEKGSVCVNGVSLTVVDSEKGRLSVAIIPYTYEHTDFRNLKAGDLVNLEFDIVGKYIRELVRRGDANSWIENALGNA